MKQFLIFYVIFLQQGCLFAQDKDTIPDILDVVKAFYSQYSTDSLEYPRVFFEKRPEGWFINTKKIKDNKVIDDKHILFFDFSMRNFFILDLPKTNKENIDPFEYIDPFDHQFFNVYPYFGYTGWYKDVIKYFGRQKRLTDKDLYALARAYSTFASSLLSDQFGYAIPEESFSPSLKSNCLTETQIKKYRSVCDTAISLFGRLRNQNPSFETTVGNVAIKYANEIMVPFHCLMVYAPEYAKNIELPDKIYPDSIITNAKRWMNNCPKNAIFLSFGDNDFYPLLYLQHHDKFRRDIYVVNYNLLGMARYIYAYSQPFFDAKGLEFSADTAVYTNEYNYYLYLRESEKILDIDQIIEKMRNNKPNNLSELDGNTFSIIFKNSNTIKQPLKIKVEERYISMNQWLLIDILNHLNDRPFILPNEFIDQLKNLNTHLNESGDVFRYPNF